MPFVRQKGRKMCKIVWLGGLSWSKRQGSSSQIERYYNVTLECGFRRAVFSAYYYLGCRVNCASCTRKASNERQSA